MITPAQFLDNSLDHLSIEKNDELFSMKCDWEKSGRKLMHPFIFAIMREYKKL